QPISNAFREKQASNGDAGRTGATSVTRPLGSSTQRYASQSSKLSFMPFSWSAAMNEWDATTLTNLNEILANLYPQDSDARRLATKAGLPTAYITFENKAISTWFHVLEYANPRGKVDNVVEKALEENPSDESLLRAKDRRPPPVVKGP